MAGRSGSPGSFRRRNPGETRYHYYNERSKALSGETLGERRARLGRAAGKTPREAAGHGAEPAERRRREERVASGTDILFRQGIIRSYQAEQAGQRERERQAEYEREARRQAIYEEYIFQQEYERDTWLYNNGYTPDNTGMTWNDLRTLYVRLRWLYENNAESGRITPEMILEAIRLEDEGVLESGWAFERIWRKYDDQLAYKQYHDPVPGRESWTEYQQVHDYVPGLSKAWWYYR